MKSKNFLNSAFTIAVCVKLIGCTPVMYSNVGQNAPMFTEKGETAIQGAYAQSTGDDATYAEGVALNVGHSFSDKWAGIMSFYSMKNNTEKAGDDWENKGSYFELGGGRYGTFGNGWFAYEIMGGIGFAGIKNNGGTNNTVNVNFIKPFIQPSLGFITPYGDVIITPRVAYVGYTKKDVNSHEPDVLESTEQFFGEQSSSIVFEPGLTLRGGFKNVKLQAQWNWSTFKRDFDGFYPVNHHYWSFGAYFLISNRYKN